MIKIKPVGKKIPKSPRKRQSSTLKYLIQEK